MATIKEIILELNTFADAEEKKQYLFEHIKNIIDEILAQDEGDRAHYIERILNAFDGTRMKGAIKKYIESIIANHNAKETKAKVGEFTSADLTGMIDAKGNAIYTTAHAYNVILGAHNTKLIMDTMTEQPYFVKMDWAPLTNDFRLPLMTNGNTHTYYPYDNVNRTLLKKTLNEHIFQTEKNWNGLDDVVEAVSYCEKFDMYEEWMVSLPPWDNIDRITNPDTNWAVRYLKCAPGRWSAVWSRMLPLAQTWRCLKKGCRLRYYFALEGEQNIGKTSFCKALLPYNPHEPDTSYWYISTAIKTIDKDFLQLIAPAAVIELADLDMNRYNQHDFKRFMTETEISCRPPYGRIVVKHPKRSIAIVTTNEHRYLRDPTGETRAIPIKSLLARNQFIDHKAFLLKSKNNII
jgi:hypothetical protein